ncbi:MAG: hypothetical protein V1859_04815 [archaeon]
MNKNRIFAILIIGLVIFSSNALAANILTTVGQTFWKYLNNIYLKFMLTLILFFMMLYGIYGVGLAKIPGFGDEGKLTRLAKIANVAMSGISTLGIFAMYQKYGIEQLLARVLGPFAVFAAVVISLAFFAMIYFGFKGADDEDKNWKLALILSGIMLAWFGYVFSDPNITSWGYFITFIALLVMLVTGGISLGGHGEHGGKESHDKPHGDGPHGAGPHGTEPQGTEPHEDEPNGAAPGGTEPHGAAPGAPTKLVLTPEKTTVKPGETVKLRVKLV